MIQGQQRIDKLEASHQEQHRILFMNAQGVIEKLATVAPTLTTLQEGYIQFALIAGHFYLYARKGNTLGRVELTIV